MTDFLIYDLKVAVLIIVFYMFYRLMLARGAFVAIHPTRLIYNRCGGRRDAYRLVYSESRITH